MVKLTKAQWLTLEDVERSGEVGAIYDDRYQPIVRLLALGLITHRSGQFDGRYTITEAGRSVLREREVK